MATSSHNTGVRPLPYNAFQSNSDKNHLYTSLTSWASPHNLLPPSSSAPVMFQLPGTSAQQQHHLPASIPPFSGSLAYVTVQSAHPSWQSYRPETICDDGFSSRPSEHYAYADPASSVPQSSPSCTRPPALSRVHELLHAQPHGAIGTVHSRQESHLATYSAPPNAHTFLPSVPIATPHPRQIEYAAHGTAQHQVQTPQFEPQGSMEWSARPTNMAAQPGSAAYASGLQQYSPGMMLVSNNPGPAPPTWNVPGGQLVSARTFERTQAPGTDWHHLEAHPEQEMHVQTVAPGAPLVTLEAGPYPPTSAFPVTALAPIRRSSTNPKLPTMPSPFVERQKKNTVSKRQGPLSKEKREKAHRMRQRGPDGKPPCIRCRFYKAGCDEGEPCAKCEKTSKSARVFHLPCCRDQIEDTNLVRRCNGRWNQAEAEFLKYPWKQDRPIHAMDIIWHLPGFGTVNNTQPLQIRFREYEPEGSISDSTASQWQNTNGRIVQVEQPPYAVCDTASLQNDVEAYFTYNLTSVDQWIFGRNRHDAIAQLTYAEALRLRGLGGPGGELLSLALQLQYLSVISQGYGSICSPNIPGIKEYDFRKLGHSVYEAYDRNTYDRPLPIAINHQMDVALVKYLKRLEEKCFKLLAKEIFKTGIRPWYELFLTLFVIFWNLEYIHHGAEQYIQSKYGTHIARQVSNVVSQQIEKWDFSFEVLMNHWQGCLRGFKPFMLARENPEELRSKGRLPDDTAFQYMINMAALLDQKGPGRFASPMTGYTPMTNSLASKWISALIKEAGG